MHIFLSTSETLIEIDHHLDSIASILAIFVWQVYLLYKYICQFNELQRISIIFTIFSGIKSIDLEINK